LENISVGSSFKTIGAEGTISCSLLLKNSKNFVKKQIAYIEIDTHAEIAENFAELTKNSEKFSVDFYFSKIFTI